MKNMLLVFMFAFLGMTYAQTADAACVASTFQGVVLADTGTPATRYVVGIFPDVNGTELDIYYRDFSSGQLEQSTMHFMESGMTVTGSWGATAGFTKITSYSWNVNVLSINGSAAITFHPVSGGTTPVFANFSYTYSNPNGGVTAIGGQSVPVHTFSMRGYDNSYQSRTPSVTNHCEAEFVTYGNNNEVVLTATGFDIDSVKFLLDYNTTLKNDISAPFEHFWWTVDYPNGNHIIQAEVQFTNSGKILYSDTLLLSNSRIDGGAYHTCEVTQDETVKCAGYNYYGQIGDGSNTDRTNLTEVIDTNSATLTGITQVSTGESHACAIDDNGKLWCWGSNSDGQLGNGTRTHSNKALSPNGMGNAVTAVAVGGYHTCAIKSGTVKCWGKNYTRQAGQTGSGDVLTPQVVSGLSNSKMLTAGRYHTCAITISDEVKCWGYNNYGQLGNGTNTTNHIPQLVSVTSPGFISAGRYHTCVTTVTQPKCWGRGTDGELGDGLLTSSNTPVTALLPISGGNGNQTVAAGWHTCATTKTGKMYCWGKGDYGEIGDSKTVDRASPVQVQDVTGYFEGVLHISAGSYHTCAIRDDGVTLYCWGRNQRGQLGLGDYDQEVIPAWVHD